MLAGDGAANEVTLSHTDAKAVDMINSPLMDRMAQVIDGTAVYAVQAGLFADPDNSARIRRQLEGAGYRVHQDTIQWRGAVIDRLRVGPYGQRAAAEQAKADIDSLTGADAFIVVSCAAGNGLRGLDSWVQVGSYREATNATAMVERLQGLGHGAQV